MSILGFFRLFAVAGAVALIGLFSFGDRLDLRPLELLKQDQRTAAKTSDEVGQYSVVCFGFADVEFGITELSPVQPGRVKEIVAQENEVVAEGAPIFRLDNRMAKSKVVEAEAALAVAQVALAEAEQAPRQRETRIALHEAAIQAARRRIEAARHVLTAKQRTQKLRDIGRDRQDAISSEEVGEALARTREFEAMLLAEIARLNDLEQQDPQLQIARAKADVSAAQARLDQAQQTLDDCTIRAPGRGVVLRILVSPGDLISDLHRPAIQFCPETPQIVRAEVDQEFADRLELGQMASIEDDVNPSLAWKGDVRRISNWYTQRRSVVDDPAKLKDVRTLECIITLAPDQPPLKIGQRVRVKLHEPRVESVPLETADVQTGPSAEEEEVEDVELQRQPPDAEVCNG